MTSSPKQGMRPSSGRIAAIVLLGPLVGTLAVFLLPFIFDPPVGGPSEPASMVVLLFIFGYFFGLVPSALAAFSYWRVAPRLHGRWLRLFGCIAIGGVCGGLGVLPVIWIFAGGFVLEPSFMQLSAIAGSFALPLTALPFSPRQ